MGLQKRRARAWVDLVKKYPDMLEGGMPWYDFSAGRRPFYTWEVAFLLTFVDAGIVDELNMATNGWNGINRRLHLFTNNYTPTVTDTLASYSEATFTGYATQNITGWGAPTIAAHVGAIQAASRTFTRTATGTTQNIYGYFVTNAGDTTLLWAERDPNAPIPLTNNGDSYTVTPRITAQDLSI